MRSIAFALVFLALLAAPMCAVAEAEGTQLRGEGSAAEVVDERELMGKMRRRRRKPMGV